MNNQPIIFDLKYTPYEPPIGANDYQRTQHATERAFYDMSGGKNIYDYITTEGKRAGNFTVLEYLQKNTGVFNQNGMIPEDEVNRMKGSAQGEDTMEVAWLKEHVFCGQCERTMRRIAKWKTREKWICPNGCKCQKYTDDKAIYYGQPEIVEEEAEVVRNIFEMYLDGSSLDQIKSYLESNGVLTKTGKTEWSKTIIQGMLSNERYTGDMLLQKTYTENCITKKVLKNRGEMAKYLVTNNHPAIIDRDTFKAVQKEIARRSGKRKTSDKCLTEQGKYSGKYALTELLVCGECGSPYRRRTWVRNGVNRKVWRCLSRVDNGTTYCKDSISVEEEMLQQSICRALRRAIQYDREAYELILSNLSYGVTGIDDSLDIFAIESQIKELKGRIEENVELAMNTDGDPQKYYDVIKYMNSQILALNEQLSLAKEKLSSEEKIGLEIARIKECLTDMTIFDKYDDRTIRRLVDHIRVMGDKRLIIVLKGGLQIEESLEWDS